MAYEYDVFLSYPRAGQVGLWVKNHFAPMLRDGLDSQLPNSPRVFVDERQPTGVRWPANLERALLRSKLLVAVWTPPYFRSRWCLAEYHSMLERERVLGLATNQRPQGLVYPVVYSDGQHFDQTAQDTQWREDLREFTCPYECFKDSRLYVDFHARMTVIATELAGQLASAPPWEDGWPIVLPEPEEEEPLALPRI